MRADLIAHVFIHLHHSVRGQKRICVEQWKGTLLLGKLNRRQICGARDGVQPAVGLTRRLVRPIPQTRHQKRIRQTCYTQTNAAFGLRFLCLLWQRKFRCIHHIIHHTHGCGDQFAQPINVQIRVRLERILDQPGQVDRSQQTGTVGWQWLLSTGVCGRDCFTISKVICLIDAINENHTRFRIIIGGTHDFTPQIPRLNRLIHLTIKHQIPGSVGLDRFHKRVCDQNRHIKHPQTRGIRFRGYKILNIGMITPHGRHHCTTA